MFDSLKKKLLENICKKQVFKFTIWWLCIFSGSTHNIKVTVFFIYHVGGFNGWTIISSVKCDWVVIIR